MSVISTPITKLFGIKHPVILAGMNIAGEHTTSVGPQ
jgi:NAD(P)H-dependent flavin oxidoreductase YrpB (nitropropane dioxygenase family)